MYCNPPPTRTDVWSQRHCSKASQVRSVKRTRLVKPTLSLKILNFWAAGLGEVKPGTPKTGTDEYVFFSVGSWLPNAGGAVPSEICHQLTRRPKPSGVSAPKVRRGAR